jgi:hypothetical protein
MKTKLFKFLKAKLAAWVLSDPSILITNNNLLAIQEKYEVLYLNATTEGSRIQQLLEKGASIDYVHNMLANKLSDQMLFNHLIKFDNYAKNTPDGQQTIFTASIKVLKSKSIQ